MKSFYRYALSERGLWLLMVLLVFSGVFDHDLWEPHEYREAGIAYNMAVSGDFIVPHLGEKPFVEKPPLFYAILALSYILTGWNPARLFRFFCALWSLGTLYLTYQAGKEVFPGKTKEGAVFSTAVLLTTAGFMSLSRFIIVDTLLAFFVTLSFYAFLRVINAKSRLSKFLFYAGLAGAFLTKGFIGPLFILGGCGLYILLSRQWFLIKEMVFVPGLAFAAFACLAWLVPFYFWDNGTVFREWFISQHFGRFTGTFAGHKQARGESAMQLLINMLPWTLAAVAALFSFFPRMKTSFRNMPDLRGPWLLIICWGGFGMVFFLLSRSFRSVYLLPLLPAWSLMAGYLIESRRGKGLLEKIWVYGAWLACAAVVFLSFLSWVIVFRFRLSYAVILAVGVAALFACTLLKEQFFLKENTENRHVFPMTVIFFLTAVNLLFPVIDYYKAVNVSFSRVKDFVPASRPWVGWNLTESLQGTIPLYNSRSIYSIREPSIPEPDKKLLNRQDLYDFLEGRSDVFILREKYELYPDSDIIFTVFYHELLYRYLAAKKDVFIIAASNHYREMYPRFRIFYPRMSDRLKCRPGSRTRTAESLYPFSEISLLLDSSRVAEKESSGYMDENFLPYPYGSMLLLIAEIPFYPNRSYDDTDFLYILKQVSRKGS